MAENKQHRPRIIGYFGPLIIYAIIGPLITSLIIGALIILSNIRESRFKKAFSRLQGCRELRELSVALGDPLEICSVNETNHLYQYYGYDAARCGTLAGNHVAVYTFMSERATYVFGMFTEEGCKSNIVKVIWVAM